MGCLTNGLPNEWIANLQTGSGYATKLIDWHDADATVVIVKGATYFVRQHTPNEWQYLDLPGIDCTVAQAGDLAILATYTDVVAVLADGHEKWRRRVAIDGVEIQSIGNGLVCGAAGIDPPGEWQPFTLCLDALP